MSLITKQIKELREAAKRFDEEGAEPSDGDLMREASDTIQLLSAKLHDLQMKTSSQYCNNDWIPIGDGNELPKDGQRVLVTYQTLNGDVVRDALYDKIGGFTWNDVTAWMPTPRSYDSNQPNRKEMAK